MALTTCAICGGETDPYDEQVSATARIVCENCGEYYTTYEVIVDNRLRNASPDERAHISGWIRDRWRRGARDITILTYDLAPILNDVRRLTPTERAHHLLLTLARLSQKPGTEIPREQVRPTDAWALDPPELTVYVHWLHEKGFIYPAYANTGRYCLTLDGWLEADRLQKQRVANATLAFMAMPFGSPRLDTIVKDYFVPAAKAAGYDLRRLNEGQPAGLIDDQLRVRLRTARFVVADLTDGNHGAYWEAGFAEGLGTPVIYTCEKSVFESPDRKKGTHFDTNHLVTVLWEESRLQAAADELTVHIRATLPTEAKLQD